VPKSRRRVLASVFTSAAVALATAACVPSVAFAAGLPDGRGYEMVSPPDKHGGDIMADTQRSRVADDGNAAQFVSLSAFDGVVGTGVGVDYMSIRSTDPNPGTNGWATHAITPRQDPLSYTAVTQGVDPRYVGELSPDLSSGVFDAWSPLTSDRSVAAAQNLYVRTDLRNAVAGSYELATACPLCVTTGTPLAPTQPATQSPYFAGASADFSHVVFESFLPLTSDATADGFSVPNLYESDRGQVRLAGVLPDGTSAGNSFAGQGANLQLFTPHTISDDGSRIFFEWQWQDFGCSGPCTNLYMRRDHTETVQLNATERTDCAGDPTCGGDGIPNPAPDGTRPSATYQDASVDGRRVFFTAKEALTDDAPLGTRKLYVYDTSRPDTDPHNITFISPDQQPADPGNVVGVIGASDDGTYVYFVATGQLVAGQPVLGTRRGIFVWHDGTVSFIAPMIGPDDENENLNANYFNVRHQARVTPDGKHLLFSSTATTGPTGRDQGACRISAGCRELYVYDADTSSLRCASCGPAGLVPASDAFDAIVTNVGGTITSTHLNRAVSDDGSRVFFNTAEALVPEDTNGKVDAYEYDVATDSVHLISSGTSTDDSYFMDASANGDDAFFLTREPLVGWDTDTNYDLYDARVHGGFPEPPRPAVPCVGDACQAPASSVASRSVPGSFTFTGAGNQRARALHKARKCRRGYVRKRVRGKVRCVKHRHRASRHARRSRHHGTPR
jgi:hypothetical protein